MGVAGGRVEPTGELTCAGVYAAYVTDLIYCR